MILTGNGAANQETLSESPKPGRPSPVELLDGDHISGERGVDYFIECRDNLEFISAIDDECVKLVVTSPPYNLGKHYEDSVSLDEYLNTQERVIEECVRILHPEGSICWQVGNL